MKKLERQSRFYEYQNGSISSLPQADYLLDDQVQGTPSTQNRSSLIFRQIKEHLNFIFVLN